MAKSVGSCWVHVMEVDDRIFLGPDIESSGELFDTCIFKVVGGNVPCEKKLLKV